jgi:hypothetical protein
MSVFKSLVFTNTYRPTTIVVTWLPIFLDIEYRFTITTNTA